MAVFWNTLYVFCVLIIRFRQFGTDKFHKFFFKYFFRIVQKHLKREKSKKKSFFFLAPGYPQNPDPDPHEDFCPDPDSQKKCGSETLIHTYYIYIFLHITLHVHCPYVR